MAASGQHLSLFIYLQGFILLCSIYFYLANMKPYQSDLDAITPDIATPVRAGQMQFGSARWLTEEEKNKGFKSIKLRKNELKILMERTRQDEEKENSPKEKAYPKENPFKGYRKEVMKSQMKKTCQKPIRRNIRYPS